MVKKTTKEYLRKLREDKKNQENKGKKNSATTR
jgi:hypothetical protein